jgi:hypothetical protein
VIRDATRRRECGPRAREPPTQTHTHWHMPARSHALFPISAACSPKAPARRRTRAPGRTPVPDSSPRWRWKGSYDSPPRSLGRSTRAACRGMRASCCTAIAKGARESQAGQSGNQRLRAGSTLVAHTPSSHAAPRIALSTHCCRRRHLNILFLWMEKFVDCNRRHKEIGDLGSSDELRVRGQHQTSSVSVASSR